MKKLIKIEASHDRLLKIYCDLSNVCNYKCWYCFPESNTGTHPWPDADIVKINLVYLINYYKSSGMIDDVQLFFLGGEPTLWAKLGDVVQYIKEHADCQINIQTNGSRTIRWWNEYASYFSHIIITVHHESADVSKIIDLASSLYRRNMSFEVCVIMDQTSWDKCKGIVDALLNVDEGWPVLAKAMLINEVTSYNEEQTLYLKDSAKRSFKNKDLYDMIPHKVYKAHFSDGTVVTTENDNYFALNMLNRYEGWKCNLGINFLYISRDGFLTGTCKQPLYGIDGYFSIFDKDFTLKFSPKISQVTCEKKICMCSGEAALPKSLQ